jgi:hypothetical protein
MVLQESDKIDNIVNSIMYETFSSTQNEYLHSDAQLIYMSENNSFFTTNGYRRQ